MSNNTDEEKLDHDNEKISLDMNKLNAIYDVPIKVSAVLGHATMQVSKLLKLSRGSVIDLDRRVGDAIDIYINNRLVAKGELCVIDEKLGITISEIVSSAQ